MVLAGALPPPPPFTLTPPPVQSSRCKTKAQLREIHRLTDAFIAFLDRLESEDAELNGYSLPIVKAPSSTGNFHGSIYLGGKERHGSCYCTLPGPSYTDPFETLYEIPSGYNSQATLRSVHSFSTYLFGKSSEGDDKSTTDTD